MSANYFMYLDVIGELGTSIWIFFDNIGPIHTSIPKGEEYIV